MLWINTAVIAVPNYLTTFTTKLSLLFIVLIFWMMSSIFAFLKTKTKLTR
jgi:uncharacterized membrane protein YhdT